jgi:hypothetical protein
VEAKVKTPSESLLGQDGFRKGTDAPPDRQARALRDLERVLPSLHWVRPHLRDSDLADEVDRWLEVYELLVPTWREAGAA